jgi:hypothetical protein
MHVPSDWSMGHALMSAPSLLNLLQQIPGPSINESKAKAT